MPPPGCARSDAVPISGCSRCDGCSFGLRLSALFDEIIQLPKPQCDAEGPLQLQISNIGSDPFIGRLGIGRIKQGVVKKNAPVGISKGPGEAPKQVKVSELFAFDALGRKSIEEAEAGEIVVFSGLSEFDIGDTLVDMADPQVWTAAQLGAIRRALRRAIF